MDGGAWKAAVHGVAKSRTRLSDFAFTFHFHALVIIKTFVSKVMLLLFNMLSSFVTEKAMAPHSSTLAWKIP